MDPQPAAGHEFRPGPRLVEPARPASAAHAQFPRDVEASLMSRDNILHRIRTAVGRSAGQAVAEIPAVRLRIPEVEMEARIASMIARVESLAGIACRTNDPRCVVAEAIQDQSAVASNSPYLAECGITALPGVVSGITDRDRLQELCATVDVGITS